MFNNLVTYHVHRADPLPPNSAQAYQYVLAGNGVFIRADTRFWRICFPIAHCRVRGLPAVKPYFELKVNRLPDALLYEVANDARQQKGGNGSHELHEALYQFRHEGSIINVVKPKQKTSATSVQTHSERTANTIFELHSHGNMRAFWSGTDDRDEQGACLYGVIGNLNHDKPEIRLRAGVYGYRAPLFIQQLFTGDGGCRDVERDSIHVMKPKPIRKTTS
jgi:PRTRC genetic system protein A